MTKTDEDLGLQTLLAAKSEIAPSLDAELLRQCYAVQKKYQFSEDRTLSASAMERLIETAVAKSSGGALP